MKRLLAIILALVPLAAYAQNSGTVTNHAFAIGKGPSVAGYTSLLCASGQLAVGSAADPVCRTVSGDATFSSLGVLTLATVNANVGAFGGVNSIPTFTVDSKGRITAAAPVVPAIPFTELTGSLACAQTPAYTGDVTKAAGACATVLATVNANVGTFGSATTCVTAIVNAKGLTTAISAATCTPAVGSVTGLGAGVAAALAIAPNVAGGFAPVTSPAFGGTATIPAAIGGTATGSTVSIKGTSNGLPSGAFVNLQSNGQFVSVGNTAPKAPFDLNENLSSSPALTTSTSLQRWQSTDGANGGTEWVSYGNGAAAGFGNFLTGATAGGTSAAPSGTPVSYNMFNLSGFGWTGSAWAKGGIVAITTSEAWSAGHQGTQILFFTTPNATTGLAIAGAFNPSGGLGVGATAADPGVGKINATNGYNSGGTVGVSCSGTPTALFASVNGIVTHC